MFDVPFISCLWLFFMCKVPKDKLKTSKKIKGRNDKQYTKNIT